MSARAASRPRRTALVTGGAGFIGSALVEHLVGDGWDVVAIDNLANGKRVNLAHIPGARVRLLVADVRRPETFASALASADAVFHLACLGVRHSLHSPGENRAVNAGGTLAMLEAAAGAGVKTFVHVSSSEVYGAAGAGPLAETAAPHPATVYAEAKLEGEAHARAHHGRNGMVVAILRPFNAFGPRCHHEGDAGEVIPKFLLRALAGRPLIVFGDGNQTRDFTYVEDTARGIALAGTCAGAAGRTINLGSGRSVSIRALAAAVARIAGRAVEIVHDAPRPGDTPHLRADIGLAEELLGFETRIGLDDGLGRLLAWYRQQGVAPERLLEDEIERNWRQDSLQGAQKSDNSRLT